MSLSSPNSSPLNASIRDPDNEGHCPLITPTIGGERPTITPKGKKLKTEKIKTTEGKSIPQWENPFINPQKRKNSLRRRIKNLKTKSKKSKHKKLLEEKKHLFQYKGERIPPCKPLSFHQHNDSLSVIPECLYQESKL